MNLAVKWANAPDAALQALCEMPLLLLILDKKGRITEIYGGELAKLGLEAGALIGSLAVQSKKLPINRAIFRQAMNGKKINSSLPVGGFIYDASFAPIFDGEQRIIGVSAFATNVTSQIRLEQELDEERYKAAQSQNSLSLARMAGGLAHEINNPLAIISGYVELIKMMVERNTLDQDKVVNIAATLLQTCKRMQNIVQGLVDFSSEQVDTPFVPIFLKDLIVMSLDLVHSRFAAAQTEVRLAEVDPYLVVECRRGDIAKVLFQLLINSLESVQGKERRWVSLDVEVNDTSVAVKVTDSGPPLAEHIKEKIFEPFFSTKGTQHAGLGLSMAKGLVENHRGSLAISPTAKNACFVLTLPKKR